MDLSTVFSTIDIHVAGEAFRIITHSPIILNKQDIQANQRVLTQEYKEECDFLLNEPRGHKGLHGCVVLPSQTADISVLLFAHHHKTFFSYSGLIATITALLETGNLRRTENDSYTIESVQGIYRVQVTMEKEKVTSVSLENSGCRIVKVESSYQIVEVDGSRYYVVTGVPESIPGIQLNDLSAIMKWGGNASQTYINADDNLTGIILAARLDFDDGRVRSVTFDPEGEIVHSPGVDSTFAMLASYLEEGWELRQLTNASIYDGALTAQVIDETANRFSIKAQGFITGMHEFVYDRDDPLQNGFLLK